jgi:hypothetical protein
MCDIQIESYPPGDYLYTDVMSVEDFLALIEKYRRPAVHWPQIDPNVGALKRPPKNR